MVGVPDSPFTLGPRSGESPNRVASSRRVCPWLSASNALRSQSRRRTFRSEDTVLMPARWRKLSNVTDLWTGSPLTTPKPSRPKRRRRSNPRAQRSNFKRREQSFIHHRAKNCSFAAERDPAPSEEGDKLGEAALGRHNAFLKFHLKSAIVLKAGTKYFTVSLRVAPPVSRKGSFGCIVGAFAAELK